MLVLIKVKSSNIAYKLLSKEEKRLENKELILEDKDEDILVVVVSINLNLL